MLHQSVTAWIQSLKAGDSHAAERLWERYFQRLAALARTRLNGAPRAAADEEDVALSVFDSLCRGAADGRFPQLADRQNLWPLLVVLTVRKAADLVQSERRQKRGGGNVVAEGQLHPDCHGLGALHEALGREPTPEFSAIMEEESRRLLDRLGSPLREIALYKLDGWRNSEIAERLQCGLRTVERRLELIRRLWDQPDADLVQVDGNETP